MGHRKQPEPEYTCGVYFLFLRKRLVYVGRSNDPPTRIASHRSNGRAFDYSLFTRCHAKDVGWVERSMIEALKPPQNRQFVPAEAGDRWQPSEEDLPPVNHRPEPIPLPSPPPPPPPPRVYDWTPTPAPVMSMIAAKTYAARYGLARDFMAAVNAGKVPHWLTDPARTGPGARRKIERAVVVEWCAEQIRERSRYHADADVETGTGGIA